MAKTSMNVADKANRAFNKADSASQSPCYVCEKMLWLSFFFDAPRCDVVEDLGHPDKMTNVGKLFSAHIETDPARGVYRIYYNGLQKSLNTPDIAKTGTQEEIGNQKLSKEFEDKVKDAGKDALKDTAKSHKIELGSMKSLLNPKTWANVFAKIVISTGAETIGSVRDNRLFSSFTGSGVITRVNNAIQSFKNAVDAHTEEIVRIRIAIFGADFGAAIARLFANKLINGSMTIKGDKIFYKNAEIEFVLMGLFDCVSARSKSLVNSMALDKASLGFYSQGLDGPMGIRQQFRRVYHAVAAHENRLYKRIDSVRKCSAPTVKEELFAGEQKDVVGGHLPGEQKRSNQLSRIPLRRMYSEALHAGVPLRSLDQISSADRPLALSFALSDKLTENGVQADTAARIRSLFEPPLNAGSLEEGLAAGARQRLHWLASVFGVPEKREKYAKIFDRLDTQIHGIQNAFNDPIARTSLYPADVVNASLRKELSAELSLLNSWQRDFETFNGQYRQPLSTADVANSAVFEQFIHDAFAEEAGDRLDQMESKLTTGPAYWGYLTVRPIDESDKFTD